jgi:NAD(P)-dependent dehydrogenase (short-subunit alcohol dehydrogenase family)
MDLELTGRRALVTGGSRGIGKAIARALMCEGVDCVICGRTEATLHAAAAELAAATGRRAVPIVADTTDPAAITRLVDGTVAALGGLDILVNNAARVSGGRPEDFAHVTDELIRHDFEEKFLGYFRCARAAVPHMRAAGWGRIINISGMAARVAGGISAGARNVAVVHLTRSLALALGSAGITVNAIYPAQTVTETIAERFAARASAEGVSAEELIRQAGARTAIGRLVTAEEIGHVVAFLASPLAAGITGEVIAVTGGTGAAVYY